MTEPQQETYTLSIETLLEIFLDGMLSGVSSALINEKYGGEGVDQARAEAYARLNQMVADPAITETIRDTIRAKVNNHELKRTVLKVKGKPHD